MGNSLLIEIVFEKTVLEEGVLCLIGTESLILDLVISGRKAH